MRSVHAAHCVLFLLSFVPPAHAARTIRFPDESVGSVSIRPEEETDFGYRVFGSFYEGWQDHGAAAGEVTIRDGFAVRLELAPGAAHNLDWIDKLPDDVIDAVESYGVPLGDEGFAKLSRLSGLRYLWLDDAGLTSAIAAHLPRLRHLQYLSLASNADVGDDAMPAVAALPELQSIVLYEAAVTDAGLEALSQSRSIQAVYAGHVQITDAGLAALAQLPNLQALSLNATDSKYRGEEPNPSITDAGLAHLSRCPSLEYLGIGGSAITDAGLERLTHDCPHLRRLELDYTALSQKGLQHLGSLTQLEQLRCHGPTIDDSVVEHFGSLGKLREIVGDVEVGNAGVKALAALPSMESLSLSSGDTGSPPPDDDCMAAIAAMPLLKKLSIQNTRITDEGFARLAGSPTLEQVQITGNRMTTRCIETLATMPNLKQVGFMSVDPRADGKPIWNGLEKLRSLDTELWICDCPPLEPSDFAKFAEFKDLARLRIEDGRPIADSDLQHLRQLEHLEWLELTSSVVTDDGLKTLRNLPALERLEINCLATEKGLETLARAPRLRYLQIGSPDLTDEIVERVHAKHPVTDIQRMAFRLGSSEVSRSHSPSDVFWRLGSEQDRKELNALEGKPAPALTVKTWIDADQHTSLADFRGKVVLVEFWGTWCGPCLARMPEVRRLNETYADRGLVVVGVHSTQAAEDAAEYISSDNIPWRVGLDDDNQSATAYAVPHWPSIYLIDRTGVLRIASPYEGDLEDAIQSLLSE